MLGAIFLCQPLSAWPAEMILSGESGRPFPLLMNLDYNLCRAEAWLAALEKGEPLLPAGAFHVLGNLAPFLPHARLALAAIAFPLDVATPELNAGAKIKVYLQDERNKINTHTDPVRLIIKSLLLGETRELLRELAAAWPKRIAPGQIDLPLLENLSEKLGALWMLVDKPEMARIENAFRTFPDSLALAMARGEGLLQSGRLQGEEDFPDQFQAALEKNAANLPKELRDLLGNYLLYLKGRWNLQGNQFAMAERQFGKLAENPLFMEIFSRQAVEAMLEHAAFMKGKGKLPEMCADLLSICALGDCHPLLESRLRGMCASEE